MKTISILGSTGSIGTQALEVVEKNKDKFSIYALSCGNNTELFKEQIQKFRPKKVSVKTKEAALELEKEFPKLEVLHGAEGLIEIAQDGINNQILVALSGFAGLYPTLAAINAKIDIALANKETLVTAGDIVMQRVKMQGINLLPVDSEHSAIHQCLCGHSFSKIRKLIITASGGPFREWGIEDIKNATCSQALAHPKWNMGKKITIDSATLMNKGLEVIEAHHLFGVDYDNIDVVVHPQSIVHSAVEYIDGSVIAQMGLPSMHIPIQYALLPERTEGIKTGSFDFVKVQNLTFEAPNLEKFPCLRLAYEAGRQGGTCPAVLNGANEEAVMAFLDDKIKLNDIARLTEDALSIHKKIQTPTLSDVIDADSEAREFVRSRI
ncbi:MAG: 1-deoxy-D-xylulose-5-phosphate reductoisomerase [bacterium]